MERGHCVQGHSTRKSRHRVTDLRLLPARAPLESGGALGWGRGSSLASSQRLLKPWGSVKGLCHPEQQLSTPTHTSFRRASWESQLVESQKAAPGHHGGHPPVSLQDGRSEQSRPTCPGTGQSWPPRHGLAVPRQRVTWSPRRHPPLLNPSEKCSGSFFSLKCLPFGKLLLSLFGSFSEPLATLASF